MIKQMYRRTLARASPSQLFSSTISLVHGQCRFNYASSLQTQEHAPMEEAAKGMLTVMACPLQASGYEA